MPPSLLLNAPGRVFEPYGLNRVIRERFLLEAEAAHHGIASLDQLNDRFAAWTEQVLNCRVHTETGQTPIARFLAGFGSPGAPRAADPVLMAEAFRWSQIRMVTKTATVSLAGNRYQVDPWLVGRRIELRYDPEDLTQPDRVRGGRRRRGGHPLGDRPPHPPRRPPSRPPQPEPTGIDSLGLIQAAHKDTTIGHIAYRDLPLPGLEAPQPIAHDAPGPGRHRRPRSDGDGDGTGTGRGRDGDGTGTDR